MLRFAGHQILKRADYETPELNLLIEGFLLHYRNLLEFFSGNKHRRARPSDPKSTSSLSTVDPNVWGQRNLTSEEQTTLVQAAGSIFEPDWSDISQYLQHCTETRFKSSRDWDIRRMLTDMEKIIAVFEAGPRQQPRFVVGPPTSSTATFIYGTTSHFEAVIPKSKKKTEG